MSRKTRTPSQPPRPDPEELQGHRSQNSGARGASFYSSSVGDKGKQKLDQARTIEGIDEEIALIRQRLDRLISNHPDNDALILKTMDILIRAYSARTRASKSSQDPDGNAIENMLRVAADNLGTRHDPLERILMINPLTIFSRNPPTPEPPAVRPESTFDAVLEMRLAELQRQVAEIKGRINTLFFFVLIAAILQFLFGITGVTPW